MTTHSKLSPSATERWLNCPGSLKLSEGIPRKESSYAAEGTAAHAIAEQALKSGKTAYLISEDQETAFFVQQYIDDIELHRSKFSVLAEHTERTIHHSEVKELGGTQDHLMLYADGERIVLHVWDYKHGQGKIVDAEENLQALSYFAIAKSQYDYLDIDEYRITIVQPRGYTEEKIKYWACGPERVEKHLSDIKQARDNPDRFLAGGWCGWCPALQICEVVREHTLRIAQMEFSDISDDVDILLELQRVTPAVTKLLKQVPYALLAKFKESPIDGYKVIQTTTHRKWISDEVGDELAKLGLSDEVIYEPRKVRSPAQIDGELEKDQRGLIKPLYTQPPGGFKVVPNSSRGKSVDLKDVSEFDEIEESENE